MLFLVQTQQIVGVVQNKTDPDINIIINNIRENKKLYLSKSNLEYHKDKLKKIEKIKFNDYSRYKTLKNLIKRAEKSNKATDFVGIEGFEIKLPKILDGKKMKLTGYKIDIQGLGDSPVVEESVVEESVVEESVVEESVIEESIVEESIVEEENSGNEEE